MDNFLFIDFESFYDPKNGYSVGSKGLSMVEYVRDSRFKDFGACLSILDGEPKWVVADQLKSVYDNLKAYCGYEWKDTYVVAHNAKFDALITVEKYGIKPKGWICTKAMSKTVLGKTVKSHSLKHLAEHFGLPRKTIEVLDSVAGKRDLTPEELATLGEYCKHDVWLCREIFKRLEKDFPKEEYKILSRTIEMFVRPKLELDVPLLDKASKEEAERRENIFKEMGIDKKEFASNIKFPQLLEARGYPVPYKPSPKKKDEDGNPLKIPALALGDVAFVDMLEGRNEELRKLCEARVAAKATLLETRTGKLARIGLTGAWAFDAEYSGASQTLRLSGGSGAGGNPQNFTRDSDLRRGVVAPIAHKLVVGDFDKVECRIVAALAGDKALLKALMGDPYSDFGSLVYGYPVSKADKSTAMERRFGKEAILGLGYQMGAKKFKNRVKINIGQDISDEKAWETVSLYRTTYKGVTALWEDLGKFIPLMAKKETRIRVPEWPVTFVHEGILLPSGLKIKFPQLRQEVNEKGKLEWVYDVWINSRLEKKRLYGGKVLENVSQGLAGELCKLAMLEVLEFVYGQVHDELILVVAEEDAEQAAERLEYAMSKSPSWMPSLSLGADVHCGRNWLEAK